MSHKWLYLLVAIVATAGVSPSHAEQQPVRHFLMSCDSTPDIECIKSISAISSSGLRSTALKPERTVDVIGGLNPIDTREEWAFPGFTFEGSAGNHAVPGIVYRPKGSEDCDAARCITGIEELQVGMQASWLNATADEWPGLTVNFKHREGQLLCGTKEVPTECHRNHNFNTPISFEIEVRMPLDFNPSAVLGSVKNLSFAIGKNIETIKGIKYRGLTMKFDPQILERPVFSNLIPDPLGTSQYADFESDASNFWIVGSRSTQVSSLGQCSNIPFITILSNSIYQSLPIWNESTQSIEVGLNAPHFNVDGSIHKGYFEASISKAMGKCLWGIDLSTKSVAKMSITYSDESGQDVQTISGKFDGENYILFSANFHYSSPRISLVLQAPSAIEVKKNETRNIAILCSKGKVRKTILGSSPKCPPGFKKITSG